MAIKRKFVIGDLVMLNTFTFTADDYKPMVVLDYKIRKADDCMTYVIFSFSKGAVLNISEYHLQYFTK
jgi:hypothetical protein